MDKKTFNTLLATVVAGTMTLGVASFAKGKQAKKGATTETNAGGKTDKSAEKKDEKKAGEKSCGGDKACGEKSCGDK